MGIPRGANPTRFVFFTVVCSSALAAEEPLKSWTDGPAKKAVIAFVADVTTKDGPNFVPSAERIAVFDNDGTLWSEQPTYFQLAFIVDRVKALAPEHPEWKTREPFASLLNGDAKGISASSEKDLMEMVAATHAGMTVDEFDTAVRNWIFTAKHPQTDKRYIEMVYQPMLELLAHLRDNGFRTYIVSGGGIEFMRPWTERVYGIPPEQVIGSSLKMKFGMRDGVPELTKLPQIDLIDDKEGKPVGIQAHIGRRPIFAAGNSDGDLQMLQYTTVPRSDKDKSRRFGLVVHHTDAKREWAYDRNSHVGKLDKVLDEAKHRGWTVVDMKTDWKAIFPDAIQPQ